MGLLLWTCPKPAIRKGHFFIEGVSLDTSDVDLCAILAAVGIPVPHARWSYSVNGSEAVSFALDPQLLRLPPDVPHVVNGLRFTISSNSQNYDLDGGPLVLVEGASTPIADIQGLASALSKQTPIPPKDLEKSLRQPIAKAQAKILDIIRFSSCKRGKDLSCNAPKRGQDCLL